MLLPVPIGENFVPYAKRPVLRRNQDLFVDGGRGGGGVAPAAAVPAAWHPIMTTCSPPCGPLETCVGGMCLAHPLSYEGKRR
jgi:hypothetical protein